MDILCSVLGYKKLKPLQTKIIKSVTEQNMNVVGILATGYGKSTCYQLPFLIFNRQKNIIVICPLISLMIDQVTKLNSLGIESVALNSNMTTKNKNIEITNILMGENKIIYMSPEFCILQEEFLSQLYEEDRIGLIAIDEAHCVSSWGNDFRPDYQKLSCLKEWLPNVPIMALTATATVQVREDIAESLNLGEYYEFVSSFNRENLFIECKPKISYIDDLRDLTVEYKDRQTIVYVRTRESTEQIATILSQLKIQVTIYHAGLKKSVREQAFNDFASKKCNWIVATVALGMGIDQNVDLIIHYGSPGEINTYYQEIGRAGRHGNSALCVLFYGRADMRINRLLLKDIENLEHRNHKEREIKIMESFLRSTECRRKVLLNYFGESFDPPCHSCDNCVKKIHVDNKEDKKIQFALQYPMFLFRVFLVRTSIKGGVGKIADVLLGKGGKKTEEYKKTVFYGIGRRYDVKMWKTISDICILNNYTEENTIKNGFGTTINGTMKLFNWYDAILPILKSNKITSLDFDTFLSFGNYIMETFLIPKDVNILKLDNKKSVTMFEELIEEIMEKNY